MDIKVHVEGWKGSARIQEGEEAAALLNGVLEVDGHLITEVSAIEVVFKGGDFATVKAHLIPGLFEVIAHTDESWPKLLQQITKQHEVRSGDDRIIARNDV